MIDHPHERGCVMTQFLSQTRYDDWIVYAALLPALTKLGIVKLPGYEPPPAVDLISDR